MNITMGSLLATITRPLQALRAVCQPIRSVSNFVTAQVDAPLSIHWARETFMRTTITVYQTEKKNAKERTKYSNVNSNLIYNLGHLANKTLVKI